MLTEFSKQWITSTCAPESISSIELTDKSKTIVHRIINESKTKEVFCFEVFGSIIAITSTLSVKPEDVKSYDFNSACNVICEKLELIGIQL